MVSPEAIASPFSGSLHPVLEYRVKRYFGGRIGGRKRTGGRNRFSAEEGLRVSELVPSSGNFLTLGTRQASAGRSNSRCGRWGSGARRPVPRPAFLVAGQAGPSLSTTTAIDRPSRRRAPQLSGEPV